MSSHDKQPLIPFSSQGAKLALIVGLAAAVVSACCCLGAGLAAITWGRDLHRTALHHLLPSAGLNQPVRDERIVFTVHGMRCGLDTIGGLFASQSATGQFCLVELSAGNLGTRRTTVSDAAQRAVLGSGRTCAADTVAGPIANGGQVFPSDLRPGRSVTGLIVFDIPRDTEIHRLELHESASSGGVRVRIR